MVHASRTPPSPVTRRDVMLFAAFLLAVSILFLVVTAGRYGSRRADAEEMLRTDAMNHLEACERVLRTGLARAAADARFLARQSGPANGADDPAATDLPLVFSRFAEEMRAYDQVRLLGDEGRELVRVNWTPDGARVVPAGELQDKSARYYFSATAPLEPGQVMVSPLDLNIEHERIEMPLKPMIRFSCWSRRADGSRGALLVLNFLARNLLDTLEDISRRAPRGIIVADHDGHFLHHPQPGYAWGHFLEDRARYRAGALFPRAWERIGPAQSDVVTTEEGLFACRTVELNELVRSGDEPMFRATGVEGGPTDDDYTLKLIYHAPPETLRERFAGLRQAMWAQWALLTALAALPAWVVARRAAGHRREMQRLQWRAHYDPVTTLPNRALFMDRLENALAGAERYGVTLAVMFVDLDGFKEVNDTHGHDAGDQLLEVVGKRLAGTLRRSDTVGRLGGDEFAALLLELARPTDAGTVARKVLDTISQPVTLTDGTEVRVGASIGIALYPGDGETAASLLEHADAAMYHSKRAGRGTWTVWSDIAEA